KPGSRVCSAPLRAALRPGHITTSALNAHSNSHAAADAERREALLRIALLHFEQQRRQHARARRPDRMTDSDSTAIDVDLRGVPAEIFVDRASLRGESFIRLDQIE